MKAVDISVNIFFQSIHSLLFDRAFYVATWIFNPIPFTILLLGVTFLIYKESSKKDALFFLSTSVLAFLFVWCLKLYFGTIRPVNNLIPTFGPSFPSGHTAVATAFFFSVLHFVRHTENKLRRYIHIAFCILCPVFVGVSRLYFSVHWLSDVLAGFVIGLISVYIVTQVFKKM